MENFFKGHFYNPTLGKLSVDGVMDEMIRYMTAKPEKLYDIIVGCDSSSGSEPHFPVAVVILRIGEGGRFFLKKVKYPGLAQKKFYSWKTRVLEEVLLSCELALLLRENFKKKIQALDNKFNYRFQYIHADIGENGATRDMVKEVTGLIRGNGFEPKIKPESFAASVVADRYT